ncbi:hypothetical protein ACFV6F_19635 [Kitasatospora phosalacinea]|uniref:hypothetical protein n=1 Tax=Kitasatospora phosalacinea TaxID=2065 RepID=UPI0036695B82
MNLTGTAPPRSDPAPDARPEPAADPAHEAGPAYAAGPGDGAGAGAGPLAPAASVAALAAAASAAGLRVLSSAQWPESAEDRDAPAIAGFVVSSFSPLAAETARRCLQRRPAAGPVPAPPPAPAPAPPPAPAPAPAAGSASASIPASVPAPAAGPVLAPASVSASASASIPASGLAPAAGPVSVSASVPISSSAPTPTPALPGPAGRPVTAVVVVSPLGDLAGAVHVAGAVDGGDRIGPLLFFQAVPNAVAGHVAARWQLTGPVVCVADTAGATAVAALLLADGDAEEALLIRVDQAHAPGGPDRAAAVLLGPGPRPGPEPQLHEGEQP